VSRHRHDDLAKSSFLLWLSPLGDVSLDAHLKSEARRGDVLFVERRQDPAYRKRLGLLGQLAHGTVLFELFRNPFTLPEFDSALAKRIELWARRLREARRNQLPAESVARPLACLVTPSLSPDKKRACGVSELATGGVYPLADALGVVLVVVDELPPGSDTLWLRLLGKGKVQRRAIAELLARLRQEPLADATMQLVASWRDSLPPPEDQLPEEQELMENWQKAYERWEKRVKTQAWLDGKAEGRAEGKAEGRAEGEARGLAKGRTEGEAKGRAEGRAEAVVTLLESRGLRVTKAQATQILACTDLKKLDRWLVGAMTTESTAALLGAATKARRSRR
jgi:predicted transposase YdaD